MKEHSVKKFLKKLGCRKKHEFYILDGFSSEFYLIFDASFDPETPKSKNTCDVYVNTPGEHACGIRLVTNANINRLIFFLMALDNEELTQKVLKS